MMAKPMNICRPVTRNQHLYVFSAPGGFYKVGISHDPEQRRRNLQCGSPNTIAWEATFEVHPEGVDPAALEREVHGLIAHAHASGEWFKVEPCVIGRAIKEAFVKLHRPLLYHRWQRFRLHCAAKPFRRTGGRS